ncbi:DUF6443 domain-containing protein [Abyssalbus ytuae]|uniref:RHS repeat-associated core domain-containing protein n=1 Tax=Abyssalbus ytuae TaxID=2926907 RepID=A0A9E6ZIQ9_9FLAO|nr:DUF6443 domain-containing protein [Abyssalbus ytuae]UOB16277.1 RHS repeat-associated core domain-containing protein [Abyssalbus ytuae]
MKKLRILFAVVFPTMVIGQTQTENYIKTTTYLSEYSGDINYNTTLIGSDIYWCNGSVGAGGASGTINIANNVLSISINGSWATICRLKVGTIKSLDTSSPLPDTKLGSITNSSGEDTGYYAKIEGGDLKFYSPYFTDGVKSTLSRNIPGGSSINYSVGVGTIYTCPSSGAGGGSGGTVTIENGILTLNFSGGWSYTCDLKLGQIVYLDTSVIPDMELGIIKSNKGENTVYKAKIENNWLVFYTDEEIKEATTGIEVDFNIDLNPKKNENITYYDGLGRPKQSIAIRAGGQSEDIITPVKYDEYGRQSREYLPYAVTSNNGLILPNALNEVVTFYSTSDKYENTPNPYSEKEFEASPLNRILKQAAPGEAWKLGSGHEIEFDYQANTTADQVRLFTVNLSTDYTPTLAATGYYQPGELYKTITRDENHTGTTKTHTSEEFKDKQGRIVLKRTYINTPPSGEPEGADTYYVYDDYGNLTYVLPPKVDATTATLATINGLLDDLCYQYKYDERNRLVEKKIPGKEKEYIVYNKLDQPVLTQDANLRKNHQWLFTKYDAFGRVVYTGIYTHTGETNQSQMQTALNNHYAGNTPPKQFEEKLGSEGSYHYYSNTTFPVNNLEVLTVNYYDNYTFDLAGLTVTTGSIYEQAIATNVKGLATGTKVRVLGTNNWITTITVYDKKGRAIYVAGKNDYLGTTDIVQTKYDFTGRVLKTKTRHQKGSEEEIVTLDVFTYDHAGRLKTQVQCIGDDSLPEDCNDGDTEPGIELKGTITQTTNIVASQSITLIPDFHVVATNELSFSAKVEPGGELIAENTYDELGQLVEKKVGGSNGAGGLQTIDYSYNIRGWLKQINNPASLGTDLFGFAINYNVPTKSLGATALYNGNISETIWKTANDNVKRAYGYQYDALNRITAATDNTGHYNVGNISYDKNGNIKSLNRVGLDENTTNSFITIDQLMYSYDSGNKLLKVTDSAANDQFGFKDDAVNTTADNVNDYTYDENGNMVSDANKGIAGITYNHLNLPTQVSFASGNIQYIYSADGTKLRKTVNDNGNVITTDYAGNYIYENGSLKIFFHPEGYFDVTGTPPSGELEGAYVYQYKDHLGNIRLSYSDADNDGVISGNTEIIEENSYYPFGLKHHGYNSVVSGVDHPYGYNGKEEQNELGLNWIDITARNYDPALGRWMNIDPLAEEMRRYSPYTFAFDNPIYFIDPDGMMPFGMGDMDEDKNFDFSQFQLEGWTSTVVNDKGEIIDHKDDGDPGIYLNERSEENLIGYESDDREYNVGSSLLYDDLFDDAKLPDGFLLRLGDIKPTILEVPLLVQLVNPAGWSNIKFLGYFARLKVLLNGGTAEVTVQILANVDKTSNLIKLLRAVEAEAKANGVSKLVINGVEILNKDLIGPKALQVFERLGYTVETVTDTTIRIVKNL